MTHVGFIGFGEVGQAFAEQTVRAEGVTVTVFRRSLDSAPTGVRDPRLRFRSLDDIPALAEPEVVIAATTPNSALAVGRAFSAVGLSGQWYLDLNSTGPRVKQELAATLGSNGVRVVDGALMGRGITLDGARAPIILAGGGAEELAELLARLGLNARAIDGSPGAAAAVKMARGVIVKGLGAACAEGLVLAKRFGVVEEVMDSLAPTFEGGPARELVEMLLRTHLIHADRRREEARMIEETVSDAGVWAVISGAVRQQFDATDRRDDARSTTDLGSLLDLFDGPLTRK